MTGLLLFLLALAAYPANTLGRTDSGSIARVLLDEWLKQNHGGAELPCVEPLFEIPQYSDAPKPPPGPMIEAQSLPPGLSFCRMPGIGKRLLISLPERSGPRNDLASAELTFNCGGGLCGTSTIRYDLAGGPAEWRIVDVQLLSID